MTFGADSIAFQALQEPRQCSLAPHVNFTCGFMMRSFLLSCPQPLSSCGTGMGREPGFSPFRPCLLSVSAVEYVQEGGGTGEKIHVPQLSGRCHLPGRRVDLLRPWGPKGPHTCAIPICGSTACPSSLPCALSPLLLVTCSASKSATQADIHLA